MRLLTTGVIVTVLMLSVLGATSGEGTTAVEDVLRAVQARYADVNALHCSFEQENQYLGGENFVQRGTLEMERPAMMRWDYNEPSRRQFISNGASLWVVHPEEKRAFVMEDVDAASQAQLFGFVIGLQDVRSHFDVQLVPDGGAQFIRLKLTPLEPMAGVDVVWVDVSPGDHAIAAVTIDDGMGNKTITRISDMSTVDDIADIRFNYEAPEGVELLPYN
jgi:outer membrane lipoprotein carrier protein